MLCRAGVTALTLCCLGVQAFSASTASAYTAQVVVGKVRVTRPSPNGFLGLALEYNVIPRWVGRGGSAPVDPVLVRLIRNLDPVGRPVIRIGGESADRTWWPVPRMKRPPGLRYDLGRRWARSARAFDAALDPRLLLGINLEANRRRISGYEGRRLVAALGTRYISALEIGNEPVLYPHIPWYRKPRGGRLVFSRKLTYGPAQYDQEVARTLKVLPKLPIAGPEASVPSWVIDFAHAFLSRHSQVRMLTTHAYGLNQCVHDPLSPEYPSVPNLLSLAASRDLIVRTEPEIALAHRYVASYRVDEMGSVTCSGRAGVSNTMASALWVLDSLFSLAQQGVNGVNLHSYPGSDNGLFDLRFARGHWQGSIHPIYYGALMFAQAAPQGSRLLRVDAPESESLRAWATIGRDRRVRVTIINDSLTSRARVQVRAPSGFGSAPGTVEGLRARSAYATGGVTLGGRGFGAITLTGALGAASSPRIASHAGTYDVSLPPASASVLTLERRAAHGRRRRRAHGQ
jgi:hypothetical protein